MAKIKIIKKDEKLKVETENKPLNHPVDDSKKINRKIEENINNWIMDYRIKKNAFVSSATKAFFSSF